MGKIMPSLSAKRRNFCAITGAAIVGVASVIGLGPVLTPALAQVGAPAAPLRLKSDFLGYSVSLSPRVGYTDNINLAPDEFRDGQTILSNLLTANAIISHPRFTALFSGDLDFSYLVEDDDFVVNQTVGGSGTATIVDNFLYFDIAGSTSRQLVGDNARFSANANAARGQRATVNSYSASPYIYRQFSDDSVAQLRYRFSQSFIDEGFLDPNDIDADGIPDAVDDDIGAAVSGPSLLPDNSRSHEALAQYESGRLFDRLTFTATAYGNLTDEEFGSILAPDGTQFDRPDFSFDQGSVSLTTQYALNTKFALTGTVGYDELDTSTPAQFFDDDALSGVFWRGGFVTRPGRKSSLRLEYGRRYDDGFIEADARYEISRRFVFTAGANRTFQTRALGNSDQISQLARRTLDFTDRLREGGEGSPREIIGLATQLGANNLGLNAQTVGVGPTNTAFAGLTGAFDKTTVGVSAIYTNADFGFREFENVTGTVNINRTLSRRVSLFGNALYRYADTGFSVADCVAEPELFGFAPASIFFSPLDDCTEAASFEGVTHTIAGTVGVNYNLTPRTRAFGQYTRSERFSPIDILEYSENAVTVGLVVDF